MVATAIPHNLPRQLTTFVGRQSEINEISDLLTVPSCRLITLAGPGGIGKTRLAVKVAERVTHLFPDGVYFVALQQILSGDSITSAIAAALGFGFYEDEIVLNEQLLAYLGEKRLLLILDNFEHVVENADIISALLAQTQHLKIVVTSREALKLRQEWIRQITGMLFPEDVTVDELNQYGALALFIERAKQLRGDFSVEEDLPHIIRICQLVEGMPLAIELASAWLKTLATEEIANEISQNLDVLSSQIRDLPERHRSIRAVFDSTWNMLTPDQQRIFKRLSIFRGTPTRQAIQKITGADLMSLSNLVNKNLVISAENGRFHIHELLRQYAYEKLVESGELETIQDAHSQYYLKLLADREKDIHGGRQKEAVEEISLDFENIRQAWETALECHHFAGISGAVEALCSYLHMVACWSCDSYLVTKAQEAFAELPGKEAKRAWARIASRNYINNEDAEGILKQCLDIARAHDDSGEQGLSMYLLGAIYTREGDYDRAIEVLEGSIPHFEKVGDAYHIAGSYGFAATIHRVAGNWDTSINYNQRGLRMRQDIGDLDGLVYSMAELATTMFISGDLAGAEHYRREAREIARSINSRWSDVWLTWTLALDHALGDHGDLQQAQKMFADTQTYLDTIKARKREHYLETGHYLFETLQSTTQQIDELGRQTPITHQHWKIETKGAWTPIAPISLLIATSESQDYASMRENLNKFLESQWEIQAKPYLLLSLAFVAILEAYQNDNPRLAVQYLALATTHESSLRGLLKSWRLIDGLKTHLCNVLGQESFEQLWQQGKALDWQAVMPEIIDRYSGADVPDADDTAISQAILVANARLVEPLSERELEVLQKISAGLTNREIADELFVGVSTIKKHINHIYGKLEVENRTQALLRAQELHLT